MRKVLALLCGVMVLAGCATQGGVEVEGRASQVSPPPSTPPLPSGTPASADPVAILRADPQVNDKIKAQLVPCVDGNYPVDDRYVDLTGDGKAELIVMLYNCVPGPGGAPLEDGREFKTTVPVVYGGYAGFVYDLATEPPTRLLTVEDVAVDFVVSQKYEQRLMVIRSSWGPRDEPCCPTDQSIVEYRWDGTQFIEEPR
jgi:hypothetical protein